MSTDPDPMDRDRPMPQPVPRWLALGGPAVGLAIVGALVVMFVGTGDGDTVSDRPAPEPEESVASTTVDPERVDQLETRLASLEARIAAQDDDLGLLRTRNRDLADTLAGLESAIEDSGTDPDMDRRLVSLERRLDDMRSEMAASSPSEPVARLEEGLNHVQRRLDRLEETPATPEPNATLAGIDHWGGRKFAVLEGAQGRKQARVGDRYGSWTLESLDADAGVAVLRHPGGFIHALAIQD